MYDYAIANRTYASYDAADRLKTVIGDNGKTQYTYDNADNLLSVVSGKYSTQFSVNNLNQITAANNNGYSYDANGNLLDDGAHSYQWDAENRLIEIKTKAPVNTFQFKYDGLSRRVAIISNGNEQRYLWCGNKLCQSRNSNDIVTKRYYPEGEWRQGISLYYGRDHLGSVRDVLTANGTQVASLDYDAYGKATKTIGKTQPDFRYAGMFYLPEAGVYLTQYRGYDPVTGKWLSRDPIGEDGGINLYTYVGNNPLTRIDPYGLFQVISGGPTPSSYSSFADYLNARTAYMNSPAGQREKMLMDYGAALQDRINKCNKNKDYLQKKFDNWVVSVDKNINDPINRHRTAADTSYSAQSTQFNFWFFNSSILWKKTII